MSLVRMLLPGRAELGDLARAQGDTLQAVADLYAYPDPVPATGWVRSTMVTTLDGAAAGADGLSGSVSNGVDRAVFAALRALSDVVVVGAGTARDEDYRRLLPNALFRERRDDRGQAPAPTLAVVTRGRGDLDALAHVLSPRPVPGTGQVLVLTCADGDVAALRARFGDAVLVAGEHDVDPDLAVAQLAARGLRRILLEGGPALLGRFVDAARVDELCITCSPLVVAGPAPRIAVGPPPGTALPLVLRHLLECDGMLLGRWAVQR